MAAERKLRKWIMGLMFCLACGAPLEPCEPQEHQIEWRDSTGTVADTTLLLIWWC